MPTVARPRPSGAHVAHQALAAVGGALLLGATFAPWSGRGAGSAIALVRIADLVLSGAVDAWVPRATGLVVYAIPLGGALLLLGAGLGRRAGTLVAAAGVVLALAGTVLALTALDRLDRTGLGPGAVVALAGIGVGGLSVALARAGRGPSR